MDKLAIKNFAVSARVKLKEKIEQKAYTFGVTKDEIKKVEMFEDTFEVSGNKYDKRLLKLRESLVTKINEKGFAKVFEEAAYTWFNRLIAIRFMEVNEYLPSGIRVFSSIDSNKVEPDIIREASNLDFQNLNIDLIYKLQDENNTEELFKYLLIKQCNELGKIMPVIFEEIEDYTELLLPDNLLQEGSIIRDLVTLITEDDWKEQVEIIGWLYQYYIAEKKDEVFEALKKSVKIKKENIPAATQLFTPDWIVKYMVENSLGRLWLEKLEVDSVELRVESGELKEKWKYYLEEADQEEEVQKQLQKIRGKNKDLKPEDIKFLDPCMGSGHILVYAFDVLYDIYKSAGYSEREIPKLILEKNLYGLDIDDRAAQLAYFAVMMKARSYNRRIFRDKLNLNICSIQESNDFPEEAVEFLISPKQTEIEKRIQREDVEYLINVFRNAKEYGSILKVNEIDFETIEKRVEEIRNGETLDVYELQYKNVILENIPLLIKQAKLMSKKYEVVCTNPPYMASGGMDTDLKSYVERNFKSGRSDLYAVFIDRCLNMTQKSGFTSMVTMHSWMFLSTFESIRKDILKRYTIDNLVHLGMEAFENIIGKVVQTVAFVIRNVTLPLYRSVNVRLVDFYDSRRYEKETQFFILNNRYKRLRQEDFEKIPGSVIAYWCSYKLIDAFASGKCLDEFINMRVGLDTGDNDKYVRIWHEVNYEKIGFGFESKNEFSIKGYKWVPHTKGGPVTKWYGNLEYVLAYDEKNYQLLLESGNHLPSRKYYFLEGLNWTRISSSKFGVRYIPKGFVFNSACPTGFTSDKNELFYFMAFMNTKITYNILQLLNPTLNFQVGTLSKLPVIETDEPRIKQEIVELSKQNIDISIENWNSYETAWDFDIHPLLKYKFNSKTLRESFNKWVQHVNNMTGKLKENEEELNKVFINIYELQNELSPDVEMRDITIVQANVQKNIKSFISYAVGCMFGRYALDEEGLIYAGGQFNPGRYKTFKVEIDNIIPITDNEYFEDDIVSSFVEFVKITFTEDTVEENLDYIADTLGKKGNETSRQAIRRYFLKDFYKEHLKTYQRRPIYWLFDSGKNDGFKALIYMHRYNSDIVAKVRTDYLHLLQRKYEAEVNRMDMVMENDNESVREKTQARKKKEKIQKQILECVKYDQVIAHVANQKVSIELDDGVKVNYDKFQGVEVPQGEGKKTLKADLMAKI